MALYESVIIGRQDLTNSQFETLIDEFISIIKSNEGEIKKTEYWGIRNLAYKINKNRKGHYYMLNIEGPSATISEYERLLGLHEDIVRFLTIRIDQVNESPSPLMNNKFDRHKNEVVGDNVNTASKANA
jgi:small subunit ribosomal protein S6